MKHAIFLIALTAATLAACGKSEQAPAVAEAPVAEPAPVAAPVAEPAAEQPAPPAGAADETAVTAAAPAAAPVAAAPAPASEPAASAAKPDLAHGEKIYRQSCAFCHDKGVAGAPKTGDAAAWVPRLAQGMDALYAAALRGKGAMPAKGGNPALADTDVNAAVDYLAAQAR
jgi:cytochrome c5